MELNMRSLLLLTIIFAMSACGGSGGGGDDDKEEKLSELTGLWMGREAGPEGVDEYYLSFDASGLLTSYDYAGDSFDDYGDCYWVTDFQVKSKGGDRYEFINMETKEKNVFQINVTSLTMRIRVDGSSVANQEILNKSHLNPSNLVPICANVSISKPNQIKMLSQLTSEKLN